jgi:uncharacterized membrane protein
MNETPDVTRGFPPAHEASADRGSVGEGGQPGDRGPDKAAPQLERIVGTVLRVGVTASSVCLAVGVGLLFVDAAGPVASLLLQVGILVLLATPIARVAASIVGYVAEGDWPFVTLTTIVLVELMASVAAALLFNQRL